ncbi:hypothetical protein [Rhizobium sullae]|nr:hypothetical protein [Rhizobium sullae]
MSTKQFLRYSGKFTAYIIVWIATMLFIAALYDKGPFCSGKTCPHEALIPFLLGLVGIPVYIVTMIVLLYRWAHGRD